MYIHPSEFEYVPACSCLFTVPWYSGSFCMHALLSVLNIDTHASASCIVFDCFVFVVHLECRVSLSVAAL